MGAAEILTVVLKGISVATTLFQAGKDGMAVIQDMKNTFGDGRMEFSQEQVEAFEARLDAKIDQFNLPIERATDGQ